MKKNAFFVASALLLGACAQVREPQGGPKDTVAPLLLQADPPNNSTRFASQRIVLRFSERVKLDRVRDKLLISPPLVSPPDVLVSGGSNVIIDLNGPLAPNTTYTFNIGDAVQDLTESNGAAGITYVVSTGEWLDSLSVIGSVVNAATDLPEEGALVMLHDELDTAGLVRGSPAYFTRTDKQGGFHLDHLRSGRFKLSALRDQNADRRFDLPNEDVAFADSLVDPVDSHVQVLRLFRELARTQRVMEAKVQLDRGWQVVFARPVHDVVLRDVDREGGHLTWRKEWNVTRDTVLLWPSDTALMADRRFAVSDTGQAIDTITYRLVGKMPYYMDARLAPNGTDTIHRLITTRPLKRVDVLRSKLSIDSVSVRLDLLIDTTVDRGILVRANIPSGKSAVLELLPRSLIDIYEGTNDTLRILIGPKAAEQSGDLRIKLKPDSGVPINGLMILQMLNGQGGVVREERLVGLPALVNWPSVLPASYHLQLIRDMDGDGRWTTGDLRSKRQPERVARYSGDVNVRAGWEVEVEWDLKE